MPWSTGRAFKQTCLGPQAGAQLGNSTTRGLPWWVRCFALRACSWSVTSLPWSLCSCAWHCTSTLKVWRLKWTGGAWAMLWLGRTPSRACRAWRKASKNTSRIIACLRWWWRGALGNESIWCFSFTSYEKGVALWLPATWLLAPSFTRTRSRRTATLLVWHHWCEPTSEITGTAKTHSRWSKKWPLQTLFWRESGPCCLRAVWENYARTCWPLGIVRRGTMPTKVKKLKGTWSLFATQYGWIFQSL